MIKQRALYTMVHPRSGKTPAMREKLSGRYTERHKERSVCVEPSFIADGNTLYQGDQRRMDKAGVVSSGTSAGKAGRFTMYPRAKCMGLTVTQALR